MSELLVGKLMVSKNEFLILEGNNGFVLIVLKKDSAESMIPESLKGFMNSMEGAVGSEVDKLIKQVNLPDDKSGVYVFKSFKELSAFIHITFGIE